jgi:hypothetical protein
VTAAVHGFILGSSADLIPTIAGAEAIELRNTAKDGHGNPTRQPGSAFSVAGFFMDIWLGDAFDRDTPVTALC